jgi:hypothetical protein
MLRKKKSGKATSDLRVKTARKRLGGRGKQLENQMNKALGRKPRKR